MSDLETWKKVSLGSILFCQGGCALSKFEYIVPKVTANVRSRQVLDLPSRTS